MRIKKSHQKASCLQFAKVQELPGFALIATISVMVLLVMIALAMLSLSSISLREQRHVGAQDLAKANARMALMMALGELQKSMGPDQNISATAGILDTQPDSVLPVGLEHPWLTGVWQAREENLNKQPDYDREKPFRHWLVSAVDHPPISPMQAPPNTALKKQIPSRRASQKTNS